MNIKLILFFTISTTLLWQNFGCNKSEFFTVAQVKGKVTYNGQPVKSGNITMSLVKTGDASITGKSGTASIAEDGTFVVSTYKEHDGAIIGTHDVSIGETDPAQPLPGKLEPPLSFEVKQGVENILNIELK
jgi:hypothetical protein